MPGRSTFAFAATHHAFVMEFGRMAEMVRHCGAKVGALLLWGVLLPQPSLPATCPPPPQPTSHSHIALMCGTPLLYMLKP